MSLSPASAARASSDRPQDPAGESLFVREIHVSGSRFSQAELTAVLQPYIARELRSEDLDALRDALTQYYIDRGFITSGARIPEQDVRDGVLRIEIVEGTLSEVFVQGAAGLRPSYFSERLAPGALPTANILEIERRLKLLQSDGLVRSVSARLVPGERVGESRLQVDVEEADPLSIELDAGNSRAPSVDASGLRLQIAHGNLTGIGDALRASYEGTRGLRSATLAYTLPLDAGRTRLQLEVQQSRAEVVERPFSAIGIESESSTLRAALSHFALRDVGRELVFELGAERRRSRTFLADDPFSFDPGAQSGRTRLSVLRFAQAWTARGLSDVVALRSTLSFGLDVLGASDAPHRGEGATPDGTFVSWVGQAQWAHRFSPRLRSSQLIARADAQWTPRALVSAEQFSIGGARSVRGYRENALVRDRGITGSLELRIPVLRSALGRDLLQLALFADAGHARSERDEAGPRTLASAGIGLRIDPAERVHASIYWGHRLRRIERLGSDPQDRGLHVELTVLHR
jgi:hemolysin activation/secretion protein